VIEDLKDMAKATGMTLLFLVIAAGILATGFSFLKYFAEPSPEYKAAARVPQLMSEADGCKVYRFVDNGTHYFTRCGAQVETVRNYTENCGKACTRHRTETITTEGNQ
jgi:hypothetical protein